MMQNLHEPKTFRRMRASSYNPTGGNQDCVVVPAGGAFSETLSGTGILRHLWMTVAAKYRHVYHDLKLEMTFDGADAPQVRAPLADFFLFGHGLLVDVDSGPIQVTRQPPFPKPYRGGLNCVFPMPFRREAVFTVRNEGPEDVNLFFYLDWEAHESLPDPVLYFHATWNEESTRPPAGQKPQPHGQFDSNTCNLDTSENYRFLEVDGHAGHYVGTGLSLACPPDGAGKWWEGDDMFVIDGEPWPPRLHGTGMEDYFNLAWGFRKVDCRPEYGVTFLDKRESDADQLDGLFSMYRFHLNDPIPFTKSLHASVEHGHANDAEVHCRSVAYWYGRPLGTDR